MLSAKKPGAIKYTNKGVKISARVTIKSKINTRRLKTSSANILPDLLFFSFSDV